MVVLFSKLKWFDAKEYENKLILLLWESLEKYMSHYDFYILRTIENTISGES